jgi:HEAT repeat protein
LPDKPAQLLLILGKSGGVARFIIPPACVALKQPDHPVTPAGHLVRQFKCEPVFWKQFEIAKKIVALHDRNVLAELEPMLSRKALLWEDENDLLARENVAFIFASLGDDRGFQIIKEMLEDRSNQTQVRYYAAHLFGDLKNPKAVPILIPLLGDKDVSYIVPWSLGQIGDKAAIPPLIKTLDDKNPDMRVLAIYALEQLDAKQALPKLRTLLNDHEKIHFDGLIPVSAAARKAITKLERKP